MKRLERQISESGECSANTSHSIDEDNTTQVFFIYTKVDKHNLSFQESQLKKYPWLAYSEHLEGALCKICVMFSNEHVDKGGHEHIGTLVTQAFTNYRKQVKNLTAMKTLNTIKVCNLWRYFPKSCRRSV